MKLPTYEHDLDPIAIPIHGEWAIRWYGIAYVLGFLAGAWLLRIYYKKGKSPLDTNQQGDLFFALMAGVLLGGRLGYFLFYNLDTFLEDPLSLFKITQGGMASHGGFLGVLCAVYVMAKRFKESFWKLADLVVTLAPPGLLFGRIANFWNGELWGKPTDQTWGVRFPDADHLLRHPSQLYQAALEGLVLLAYTQLRVWLSPVLKNRPGQLSGEFLLGYAIVRIIGELYREPDEHIGYDFGFVSRGSLLSLLLAIAGIAIIVRARRQTTNT